MPLLNINCAGAKARNSNKRLAFVPVCIHHQMLLPVRVLMRKWYLLLVLVVGAALLNSCSSGKKTTAKPGPATNAVTKNGPPTAATNVSLIPYLTAAEEAKTFDIRDGYKLELVLGDPVIREPVAIAFDGDGRMFVAEM